MAVQTEEVRDLADFAPEGLLVTSFYLNVDAKEFTSPNLIETSFDSLIHTAEDKRKAIEDGLSHEGEASLRGDLAKIRELFEDFNREDANGIAIFSCSGAGLWEVIRLPDPVDSRVYMEPRPHISQIATFLSHTKPTAILLTDKQNARIFTMKGGDVREWTDFQDYVPQRSTQGGWSQMRYQRRSDNWAKHHVDHAADLTLRLLQHYPFDWLILGVEVERKADLEQTLHPYLKERVIGEISVRIDATPADIVEKAQEVREEAETRLIDDLVNRIQDYAGAGGRGTIGLADTLKALNEQKVQMLLVQQGYRAPGTRCPSCEMLFAEKLATCPACNGEAEELDDVVDAAVQKALELGSTVEVATEYEKLEPIQNIGAVMYY